MNSWETHNKFQLKFCSYNRSANQNSLFFDSDKLLARNALNAASDSLDNFDDYTNFRGGFGYLLEVSSKMTFFSQTHAISDG